MKFRTFFGSLVAVTAAALLVNYLIVPIPGLEWARPDTKGKQNGDASSAGSKRSGRGGGRGGFDSPAPVTVAAATLADVSVYLRGVGTAKALATVTVRPQVDGKLIKVHFREGQDVKRGDLLAEIDPIIYQAQLDQAIAKRRFTQVQLDNAEADLKRVTSVGAGVVTQKSVDTQRALVAQFEAQLKQDSAAIANAEAVLGYTRIVSPIDGRTGQRLVDEGNLVRSGDAGIVTIAQIRPLSIQFTLPQQQLSQVNTAMERGPVPVEALGADDRTVIDNGILTFIDNQVDQTTGTVRMKADMQNERLQLWPGQFANVRVRTDTLRQTVTVPTASVQRGPQGAFVYVTSGAPGSGKEISVALRQVVVTQQSERVSVVTQGVKDGEFVVTSGFARLKDSAKVSVSPSEPALSGEEPGAESSRISPRTSNATTTGGNDQAAASADNKRRGEQKVRAEGEQRPLAEGDVRRERSTGSVVQ